MQLNILTFSAVINSGSLIFSHYYKDGTIVVLDTPYTVINGINTIEISNDKIFDSIVLEQAGLSSFDIDFTDISIRELTTKTQRKERRDLVVYDDGL